MDNRIQQQRCFRMDKPCVLNIILIFILISICFMLSSCKNNDGKDTNNKTGITLSTNITKQPYSESGDMPSDIRIKFDKERWKENQNERYKMVDNLVRSEILINLSYGEVKELLGETNLIEELPNLRYDLSCSELLLRMYLRIYFKDGKVVEAYWYNE